MRQYIRGTSRGFIQRRSPKEMFFLGLVASSYIGCQWKPFGGKSRSGSSNSMSELRFEHIFTIYACLRVGANPSSFHKVLRECVCGMWDFPIGDPARRRVRLSVRLSVCLSVCPLKKVTGNRTHDFSDFLE